MIQINYSPTQHFVLTTKGLLGEGGTASIGQYTGIIITPRY